VIHRLSAFCQLSPFDPLPEGCCAAALLRCCLSAAALLTRHTASDGHEFTRL
jgi:hypothetical protein